MGQELEYVERVEQVDQIIYQEQPREEPAPQVVELVRRIPATDIQEVIKEVRIPTVEYVERVEEVPQVHYEEVAQEVAVPKVEFWEVVKEHVEAQQEFVSVQKTEVIPVPKDRSLRTVPLSTGMEFKTQTGMSFVS